MNKLFSWAGRPVLNSILVTILFLIVVGAGGAVSMMTGLDSRITLLIAYLLMAVGLGWVIFRKKRWIDFGFPSGRAAEKAKVYRYIPLFLMALLPLVVGLSTDLKWTDIGFVVGFMAVVAFVEETIFRGIVLKLLQTKGNLVAILGSSLLFSGSHALNALAGKDWMQTSFQIAFALLAGVILATLMIQTNNILPLILYHFVNNTVSSITRSDIEASLSLTISVAVLAIGIVDAIWLSMPKRRKAS